MWLCRDRPASFQDTQYLQGAQRRLYDEHVFSESSAHSTRHSHGAQSVRAKYFPPGKTTIPTKSEPVRKVRCYARMQVCGCHDEYAMTGLTRPPNHPRRSIRPVSPAGLKGLVRLPLAVSSWPTPT